MELSTRARYAVEAIIDLAVHAEANGVTSLSSISERTAISISYLEQLFAKLKKANIITSIKGPKGGYKFNKELAHISILDILMAVDEPLETRSCKGKISNNLGCAMHKLKCKSHDLWEGLLNNITSYLRNISLEDLMKHVNGFNGTLYQDKDYNDLYSVKVKDN